MRPEMFVVDDDAGIRETLRLLLEDAGYRVNEACDGATALDMLHAMTEPQIVLLDQYLPRLTGDALLQAVASDASLRLRHAYVLLTADANDQARQIAENVPQMDVAIVSKPFDVDDLLNTITAVTGRLSSLPRMFPGERPHLAI